MFNHCINTIYTKNDEQISEYLVVVFETNYGFYKVGHGIVTKIIDFNPTGYIKEDFLENLKVKYGSLQITDLRVTYDSNMYFFISNSFLLVLGFTLSSETENSVNEFWIEDDLQNSNKSILNDFYQLNKVVVQQ